jgi:nitrite reductase/ring-hydroxylating ferredoxin subunit
MASMTATTQADPNADNARRVRAGTLDELRREGKLLTKVGALPVVVFWADDRAYAIEDRCPHMGFPLHRGSVEAGLVTCHWHHARFDLVSGCTLDLWADDAHGFIAEIEGDNVWVEPRDTGAEIDRLQQRLREGMEDDLTLVIAKNVLGLLEAGAAPADIVRTGMEFGCRYRAAGWGSGLTVLVAMANVLGHLRPDDQATALVHALRFVANDSANHPPRFAVSPLRTTDISPERLDDWYRRMIETRSADGGERALQTLIGNGDLVAVESTMIAAVTDHVFIDEGHSLDFTNKAREALDHLGVEAAALTLPTLVAQTASADRSEEHSEWQYPHDLVSLAAATIAALPDALAAGAPNRGAFNDVAALAHRLLEDDPDAVVGALLGALCAGASEEQIGQAIAFAASLRLVRFHIQNEHGDWNTVHHTLTSAHALHCSLMRAPTLATMRGAVHGALRVYLDRFLNIPSARQPVATEGTLDELAECFESQGQVDAAGNVVWGYLRSGGSRAELIAALGHHLLNEDTSFHWYQSFEASVMHALSWPEGSDESALALVGFARFLAAHTPSRRELPNVMRISRRLRRGDQLFEAD